MKEKCLDLFGCRRRKIGWMRHVLTFLSILLFLMGAMLLMYIVWVIATSYHVARFLTGTMIFTYSVLALGLLLFLAGLIGWMASTSERVCTLRLYLTVLVIVIASEIGGIVAINVLGVEMDQMLKNAWTEVNQATRNLVQGKMNCCGYEGPHEFSNKATVIAESCYQFPTNSLNSTENFLKPDGCGSFLMDWFDGNKIIWCSVSAVFGGLQLMCVVICAHIIRKLKDKMVNSRTSSQKNLNTSQYI